MRSPSYQTIDGSKNLLWWKGEKRNAQKERGDEEGKEDREEANYLRTVLLRPMNALSLLLFSLLFVSGCLMVRNMSFASVVLGVYLCFLSLLLVTIECCQINLHDGTDAIHKYFFFWTTCIGRGFCYAFLSLISMQSSYFIGLTMGILSAAFIVYTSISGQVPKPIFAIHSLSEQEEAEQEVVELSKVHTTSGGKKNNLVKPPSG